MVWLHTVVISILTADWRRNRQTRQNPTLSQSPSTFYKQKSHFALHVYLEDDRIPFPDESRDCDLSEPPLPVRSFPVLLRLEGRFDVAVTLCITDIVKYSSKETRKNCH